MFALNTNLRIFAIAASANVDISTNFEHQLIYYLQLMIMISKWDLSYVIKTFLLQQSNESLSLSLITVSQVDCRLLLRRLG